MGVSHLPQSSLYLTFVPLNSSKCLIPSPKSSPSIPWSPSTSPSPSGRSSTVPRLPLQDSPSLRPLPVPWSLTINIVVFMLEIGTLTRSFLMFLIHLSKSTMELLPIPPTQATWMQAKSGEPSARRLQSIRIRVGRNIDGFGLSPGITKQQRIDVENLMKKAFANLKGDLAGSYFPLTGMSEKVRQQLVDDHFLFMSGDPNLKVAGMERDWPEGRGIFHNKDKTFLTWVNEEDQLRIISMQKGGDVKE